MTVTEPHPELRIGVDLGGTKIEGVAMEAAREYARERLPTPREDYAGTVRAIVDLVHRLEATAGGQATVGIGVPGSISPKTGLMQNANSTWLNGRAFDRDLTTALGRPVRIANDANCFALSEARDGAAAGAHSVFGVILGTGCGGGLVIDGHILDGPHGIGGEWGHNPLPWPEPFEIPGPLCWCGRHGCMETWVSGTGLEADHLRMTGQDLSAGAIAQRAASGDFGAQQTLDFHIGRLARGLAHVVNIIDPEVIVLGGGLSKLMHLYPLLPGQMIPYIFAHMARVEIRPPKWGDASGVRGAALLWE
jgi:fructokinase